MTDTYCDVDYNAWLIAHDFNFLPENNAWGNNTDIGGDESMVSLVGGDIHAKCLTIYNDEWGDFTP